MVLLRRLTSPALLLLGVSLIGAQAQSGPAIPEAHVTFTNIDVPGAVVTNAFGINAAGDIVGIYGADTYAPHSFLLRGGNFILFDYPNVSSTSAMDINDSGLIVGYVVSKNGQLERGFLYDGTSFTPVSMKGKTATVPRGINNAGQIAGGVGTPYSTRGFELRDGQYHAIDFPGAYIYAYATGINTAGKIVGYTDYHAYAYSRGKYGVIDAPGADISEAWRINDDGVIVGWYGVQGPAYYGFALKNGKYISFGYPGAKATFALGINSFGQIVGGYTFDYQTYHGFVTSPITPMDFEQPDCCRLPPEAIVR